MENDETENSHIHCCSSFDFLLRLLLESERVRLILAFGISVARPKQGNSSFKLVYILDCSKAIIAANNIFNVNIEYLFDVSYGSHACEPFK